MQVDVRPWKPGDEEGAWAVLREASFSNLRPSFQIAVRRKATVFVAVTMTLVCFATGNSILETVLWLAGFVTLVYVGCLAATLYFLYGPNFNDMKQIKSTYFANPHNHFWVADAGGEIVGTIAVVEKQNQNNVSKAASFPEYENTHKRKSGAHVSSERDICTPKVAWLRRMAVKSNFRGLGIAKRLVRAVIEFCQCQGYDVIFLITTEVHQPARALYTSMGFMQKAFKPYTHLGGLISVWTYEFEMALT